MIFLLNYDMRPPVGPKKAAQLIGRCLLFYGISFPVYLIKPVNSTSPAAERIKKRRPACTQPAAVKTKGIPPQIQNAQGIEAEILFCLPKAGKKDWSG
jgi:hypothetical protein